MGLEISNGLIEKEQLAMLNHVQNVHKAMRFISSNSHKRYSELDMINFIRSGKLTPFFYYNYKLTDRDIGEDYNHRDYSGLPHGVESSGNGFIQMFNQLNQQSVPNIVNPQIRTIPPLDSMIRYGLLTNKDEQEPHNTNAECFSVQELINSEYINQTDVFTSFVLAKYNASYSCKFKTLINNSTWYGNITVSYISEFDVSDSEFLSFCFFHEEQLQALSAELHLLELGSTHTTDHVIGQRDHQIHSDISKPSTSKLQNTKKSRLTTLQELIERALETHPTMIAEELWQYFRTIAKEGRGIFKDSTDETLIYKNVQKRPTSRKSFIRTLKLVKDKLELKKSENNHIKAQ